MITFNNWTKLIVIFLPVIDTMINLNGLKIYISK